MKSISHIVFAGGGTGGHLFPGLAVAKELSANRPGLRITFVGTAQTVGAPARCGRGVRLCAVAQPAAAAAGQRGNFLRRGKRGRLFCRGPFAG